MKDKELILGFLIGFISQKNPKLAYVHFIGVNPRFRNKNIGRKLYECFFEEVKKIGVMTVECVTSIDNKLSINFHRNLGFKIKNGNSEINGISYFEDYDGKGENRVLFNYEL